MESADVKGFGDFVSEADLEAQEAALGVIRERHPDHRILAEEGDPDLSAATGFPEPIWIVDPLDGTKNFLHGHPMYAVSVAVAVEGRPLAGTVVSPATGERWWATRGSGAWKDGKRIGVSAIRDLRNALVGTGFPFKGLDVLPRYLRHFEGLMRRGAAIRRAGAAAIDLSFLAEGRFDAFWELILNPWDFAAGLVIVEEAGGVLCRPDGAPVQLEPGPLVGANSRQLLHELLEALSAAETRTDTP